MRFEIDSNLLEEIIDPSMVELADADIENEPFLAGYKKAREDIWMSIKKIIDGEIVKNHRHWMRNFYRNELRKCKEASAKTQYRLVIKDIEKCMDFEASLVRYDIQ
jgi:hypothetical protein